MDTMYQLIAIIVVIAGILRGFQLGLSRQGASLLGCVIGILACLVAGDTLATWIAETFPFTAADEPMPMFLPKAIAVAAIYLTCAALFAFLSMPLRLILSVFGTGMINRVIGAVAGMFRYVMILSVVFNVLAGFDRDSPLVRYATGGDANMAQVVCMTAPPLLGSISIEDLAYAIQLYKARNISLNNPPLLNVQLEENTHLVSIANAES